MSDLHTPTKCYLILHCYGYDTYKMLWVVLRCCGPCDFNVSPRSKSFFFILGTFNWLEDLLGQGLELGQGLDNCARKTHLVWTFYLHSVSNLKKMHVWIKPALIILNLIETSSDLVKCFIKTIIRMHEMEYTYKAF